MTLEMTKLINDVKNLSRDPLTNRESLRDLISYLIDIIENDQGIIEHYQMMLELDKVKYSDHPDDQGC